MYKLKLFHNDDFLYGISPISYASLKSNSYMGKKLIFKGFQYKITSIKVSEKSPYVYIAQTNKIAGVRLDYRVEYDPTTGDTIHRYNKPIKQFMG